MSSSDTLSKSAKLKSYNAGLSQTVSINKFFINFYLCEIKKKYIWFLIKFITILISKFMAIKVIFWAKIFLKKFNLSKKLIGSPQLFLEFYINRPSFLK